MKLYVNSGTADELRGLMAGAVRPDYAYAYPPRQAYRAVPEALLTRSVSASAAFSAGPANLYAHFPFCQQICGFCNLFSIVAGSSGLVDVYISSLIRELAEYLPHLVDRPMDTLYLGGGTPSLLSPAQLERFLVGLQDVLGIDVASIPEVAMEVSPGTVDKRKLNEFRELGVNRINLGFQSLEDSELSVIGRRYDSATPLATLSAAQDVGFKNVCVDLIYGLPGQRFSAWCRSVDRVIECAPETVCAYPLTLRPRTGFSMQGYSGPEGREQYEKYDYVDESLRAAGYRQETHVRWAKGRHGGYRQKANHWALQQIVGIGAGARGYLWECDYRNGYSVRHREKAFRNYLTSVEECGHARTGGFIMNSDERRRKALVLALIHLDSAWFEKTLGEAPDLAFADYLATLSELGLITRPNGDVQLTPSGVRYRDLIVQYFFSREVRDRLQGFDYDE